MLARMGHYIMDTFELSQPTIDNGNATPIRDYVEYPVIEYAPDYILGEGVLGRCFPSRGLIQLKRDVHGHVRDRVKDHELAHYNHPEWSEFEVRAKTNTLKPPEDWYL